MTGVFRKFAQGVADGTGSPWAFFAALTAVLAWGATGPHYQYSDTWQLVASVSWAADLFITRTKPSGDSIPVLRREGFSDALLPEQLFRCLRHPTSARRVVVHVVPTPPVCITRVDESSTPASARQDHISPRRPRERRPMTRLAQGLSIVDVEPKLGEVGPASYVVGDKTLLPRRALPTALLALVPIARENTPSPVPPAGIDVSGPGAAAFPVRMLPSSKNVAVGSVLPADLLPVLDRLGQVEATRSSYDGSHRHAECFGEAGVVCVGEQELEIL